MPELDHLKFVPMRNAAVIENNTYKYYTDECLVDGIRSKPERLFERWLNTNAEWYYKNGDTGQTYFSIVYFDGNMKQHLFYADYICKIKGDIWIMETKGGETDYGIDSNIDINVLNKFNAFKEYADRYKVKWGFIRDKYDKLYINNTEYVSDMDNEKWMPLDVILS